MNNDFLKAMGVFFVTLISVFVGAVIGGTIVWYVWPIVVPVVLPLLVKSGAIPAELTWWVSVCLTWLCSTLFKATLTVNK